MYTAGSRVHGYPYGYVHGQPCEAHGRGMTPGRVLHTAAVRTRPAVCISVWWTMHTASCQIYWFIQQMAAYTNETTNTDQSN